MANAPTDEQLLAEHLAGAPKSFEQLVRRHTQELYQFLARFVGSSAVAEDIVQDAFVQVHLSAGSFDFQRRFKPWLFTIAANKARDHLRSRSRRPEVPLDAHVSSEEGVGQRFLELLGGEETDPADMAEKNEVERRVRQTVEELPEPFREVILLAYFQGFPYRDIAEMLAIPLGTVKSRLHAAVATFSVQFRRNMGIEEKN